MESNNIVPFLVVGVIMLAIGSVCFFYPQQIKKYDTRMIRFLKNHEDYIFTTRIIGLLFMVLAGLTLVFVALVWVFR